MILVHAAQERNTSGAADFTKRAERNHPRSTPEAYHLSALHMLAKAHHLDIGG